MKLSKKISLISPSPTLAITAKANKMKAEGVDVIGFGAGEPDFDTPANIKEAAKLALDQGFTKYTPTSGIKELKEAIRKKFIEDNQLEYSLDQILVSCGAKHSIFNIILALCEAGDEVIIPSPYWVSYPEMLKIAGAAPVSIETTQEANFKITPRQLKEAVTAKTKLVILNSPSNPTGMIYEKDELIALSKIIAEADIYCISDEIYEKIIYDNCKHVSIASLGEEIKNLTIVVNGLSKTYAMTGWRIGYAAGPKDVIQAMSNLQDHSTSNPTSIAQYAAVEALNGPQEILKKMVDSFRERRNFIVDKINSIKGLSCLKPQGAFYLFVDISRLLGKKFQDKVVGGSLPFTELLLENGKVAVVPGGVFGNDNFIRLSYAASLTNIKKGLERLEKFVEQLV
ncbi:MAG: pyridoxal phosphate-dependent aminotransferase [Elusimicrobiota bacterium]